MNIEEFKLKIETNYPDVSVELTDKYIHIKETSGDTHGVNKKLTDYTKYYREIERILNDR